MFTLINGFGMRVNGSVMEVPVPASAARIWVGVAAGACPFQDRPRTATCGVAIDVPLKAAKVLPVIDELMPTPGASRSTATEWLLNTGTLGSPAAAPGGHSAAPGQLPFVVAPTATAVEMHAGPEIAKPCESFPEAMIEATPTDSRLSMAALVATWLLALSQLAPLNRPPPRLMLTAAIGQPPLRSASTRCRPAA